MLEYDRINISEEIDVNKTSESKECDICHYWYFKDIGFKYEPYLCNGCHDLIGKAMSFNDVAVVYVKESAYRIHFGYMSKDDAISIKNNTNLVDKIGAIIKKNNKKKQRRDTKQNKRKNCYENDKERLRGQTRDKCRNLSEEEKNKKREYGKS